MTEAPFEPDGGVAQLADRPVDGARVARVMAVVAALGAVACVGHVEWLLSGANVEPPHADALRGVVDRVAAPARPPGRVAVLVVDGLRTDEAWRLPIWRRAAASRGTVRLSVPTLSRPYYHALLTGVPAEISGVRTNRFRARARFESVADRVRAAGGGVSFVADGIDWMRRMHGRPGDGGSDRAGSIERLREHLAAFERTPAPALLVVHTILVDHSAHAGNAAEHAAALRQADGALATLLETPLTIFATSDHGHVRGGGHGGAEPIVLSAPLLVRAPGAPSRALGDVQALTLAPSIASALGVARPRSAMALAPGEAPDRTFDEAARHGGRATHESRAALSLRRRWALPFALVCMIFALGPIKRAFGLDRSALVAVALWPLLVIAAHLALGRPLSLSAVDGADTHTVRVACLGLGAALVTLLVARLAARDRRNVNCTRRVAATIGWVALGSALFASAASGFALGPWQLSARAAYLPLLAAGAAAPALALVALVLAACSRPAREAEL